MFLGALAVPSAAEKKKKKARALYRDGRAVCMLSRLDFILVDYSALVFASHFLFFAMFDFFIR